MSETKYRVILADPPWQYRVHTERERPSGHSQMRGNVRGIAARHYGVTAAGNLHDLPVAAMAAPDAALFMWATMPCLPEAFELMRAWAFTYKTVAFTWVKISKDGGVARKGLGHYTRSNAELCLIGTRGHPQRIHRDVQQIIMAPRREHSRKPDEQYGRIMRLFDGPYLELFARQQWPGWDVRGNEAAKFPAQPFLFGEGGAA